MDWRGYPQHPDAHPERPWWRGDDFFKRQDPDDVLYWRRSDGATLKQVGDDVWKIVAGDLVDGDRLLSGGPAAYDAEHPLPPPELGPGL